MTGNRNDSKIAKEYARNMGGANLAIVQRDTDRQPAAHRHARRAGNGALVLPPPPPIFTL